MRCCTVIVTCILSLSLIPLNTTAAAERGRGSEACRESVKRFYAWYSRAWRPFARIPKQVPAELSPRLWTLLHEDDVARKHAIQHLIATTPAGAKIGIIGMDYDPFSCDKWKV